MDTEAALKRWIAEYPEIWQYELLRPDQLVGFAKERGFQSFGESSIIALWRLGLLRADLVATPRKHYLIGLQHIRTSNDGRHLYIDARKSEINPSGWLSAAKPFKFRRRPLRNIELYFHPFRFYILYHLQRVFSLHIDPLQLLWSAEALPKLIETMTNSLRRWTSSPEFVDRIEYWNTTVDCAVAAEPIAYETIFKRIKWNPLTDDQSAVEAKIENHRLNVAAAFQDIGLQRIAEMRRQLCTDAEVLDPNKGMHVLIRLMKGEPRLKLKGSIGGSLLLLTMAEMLRRVCEKQFSVQLPEEDELGFGVWTTGARKWLYGTERILDAPKSLANEYIRHYGLDYSVRVRCYVEGATELGALNSIVPIQNGIEIIDLRGNFIESKGRGLAFRDSLRNDMNSHVFSLVILDGDRDDFVRAVRAAASQDEMCGMFFVSNPDFELQNFTKDELCDVIWKNAVDNGAQEPTKQALRAAINKADTADAILEVARATIPELCQLSKGVEWGEALMAYVGEHPTYKSTDTEGQTDRPIINIVKSVFRALSASYSISRQEYKVDPMTGQLVKRKQHS